MSFNCEFFKVEPWQLKLFLCPQTKKRFESIWGSTYDSRGDALNAAKKIRTWLILTMGTDAGIWAADCSDHAEAVKISKDLKHSPLIPPGLWLSLIMGRYSFRNLQNCIQMSEKPNKIWLTSLLFTGPFSFFARIKILNLTTNKAMFSPTNKAFETFQFKDYPPMLSLCDHRYGVSDPGCSVCLADRLSWPWPMGSRH